MVGAPGAPRYETSGWVGGDPSSRTDVLVGSFSETCHRGMHRFVLSVRANVALDAELEIQTMSSKAAYLATALVVLSVAVNLLHTASHAGQHVMSLPGWQLAYIAVVIYTAPIVAAVLLWTRYRLAGAWLLAASMAGSFVFGLVLHFLVSGPDNVFTLPSGTWRTAFQVTAVLLLMLEMIGSLIGLWAAQRIPQTRSESR
jgi:hypothetical protein